jgi:hypothetical protein
MKESDLVRELREANERLAAITERLEHVRLRHIAITASELAELRWLSKDYEDENNGDWTR